MPVLSIIAITLHPAYTPSSSTNGSIFTRMHPHRPYRMLLPRHQPDYQMEPVILIMDVYADLSGTKLSGYLGRNETSPKGYAGISQERKKCREQC